MSKNICKKNVCLIFVPHEDDEINISGDFIYQAIKTNMKIFVVYTTNGDFKYKAITRIHEAQNAVHFLNKDANCIFLGYGDTLNHCGKHLFYADTCTQSPSGHNYTYGISNAKDFAYQFSGKHHCYTRKSYENDVYQVIMKIHPDIIFSIDYDVHSDHRMASIVFEQCIGKILKQYKKLNYNPIVYKGFAYTTGFHAINDFYSLNLAETKMPIEGEVIHYYKNQDLLNSSIYIWKNRLRFPLAKVNTGHFLLTNKIFKALCKHRSQSAGMHAGSIINSDKIFWQRRTDSCSYYARVEVSSNSSDAHYLNDFQLYNTDDIDSEIPVFNHYAWKPDKKDLNREITFTWDKQQKIKQIVVYGLLDEDICIHQIEIKFDNGEKILTGPVPGKGMPLIVTLKNIIYTRKCSIKLLKIENEAGVAECEFYATTKQANNPIQPFIKIMDKDNFIYDYLVHKSINNLQLQIYYFECQGKVTFEIVGDPHGAKISKEGNIDLRYMFNKITVKAYLNNQPSIQDTVIIKKVSQSYIKRLKLLQKAENFFLIILLRLNRKYIYLRKKYINDI